MTRQLKREVKIGNIKIGGTNPIAVQTMLNVPVKDIAGNVAQAKRVVAAGCQIVRVTVPSPSDAAVVAAIKEAVDIPVVADIHFDYRAALAALDAGADKIRINPGNIGDDDRVKAVADACNQKGVPIRIGVNGGSLEKHSFAHAGTKPYAAAQHRTTNRGRRAYPGRAVPPRQGRGQHLTFGGQHPQQHRLRRRRPAGGGDHRQPAFCRGTKQR